MPTNTYTYPFANGANPVSGYGDRWQIQFGGTWALNEKWGLIFTTTVGDYDVGCINFFTAGLLLSVCNTFKNRVYIGAQSQFNFSDNGDALGWEQQNSGAGFVKYMSYFGAQDTIYAISQLQGRLVIVARRSVQIWTPDADPNNFALVQEMDNIGTAWKLSVQNIGDLDVIILDDTGFRSLRTREVTLNAYVDDIGTPVDALVQADLATLNAQSLVAAIVDPATKNYWCYLNGKIYVHAQYPSSKVSAWSTYLPTYEAYSTVNPGANYVDSLLTPTVVAGSVYKWTPGAHEVSLVNGTQTLTAAGYFTAAGTTVTINGTGTSVSYTGLLQLVTMTTFAPQKFVVLNGIIYARAQNGELIAYGGSTGQTYDTAQVTATLPFLDDKTPKLMKMSQGMDAAMSGWWQLNLCMDPVSGTYKEVYNPSSPPTGVETKDSTFDLTRIGFAQKGTHYSIQAISNQAWGDIATLSAVQIHYNLGSKAGS